MRGGHGAARSVVGKRDFNGKQLDYSAPFSLLSSASEHSYKLHDHRRGERYRFRPRRLRPVRHGDR